VSDPCEPINPVQPLARTTARAKAAFTVLTVRLGE